MVCIYRNMMNDSIYVIVIRYMHKSLLKIQYGEIQIVKLSVNNYIFKYYTVSTDAITYLLFQ